MTHQFKFGDRIRNAQVPHLTFIYLRQDSPTTCICFDETAQEKRMIATDMELVPHPDTVRLDWLESKGWKPKTIAGGIIQLTRKAIDDVMCEKAV